MFELIKIQLSETNLSWVRYASPFGLCIRKTDFGGYLENMECGLLEWSGMGEWNTGTLEWDTAITWNT